MMIVSPPCKDCSGRYIGCHAGCPTWQQWKAEDEARKAAIRKEKQIDDDFRSAQYDKSVRFQRKYHDDSVRGRNPW